MAEPVEAWWRRRQWSKNALVPYPIGSYRAQWERYPVLIRQYRPDLNAGITLTQIPPAAEVFLTWQCEAGHVFVATPEEQRNRPGGERRRSVWCPVCAQLANPPRIKPAPPSPPERRPSRGSSRPPRPTTAAPGEPFWSSSAPKTASAAEAELRQRIASRFDFDLCFNAVAVTRPFHGRHEVWPDIVIPELRIALEYDTVGRHGLEHVGPRDVRPPEGWRAPRRALGGDPDSLRQAATTRSVGRVRIRGDRATGGSHRGRVCRDSRRPDRECLSTTAVTPVGGECKPLPYFATTRSVESEPADDKKGRA